MTSVFSPYHTWRSPACFCIEFLLISSAVVLAAMVRFSAAGVTLGHALPYLPHAFLIAFVCQICMYYADLFDLRVAVGTGKLFTKLLQSLAMAMVVLMVMFYLLPQVVVGRGVFLLGVVVAFCFIIGWRLLYQRLYAMQQFKVRVLILGTGDEAKKVAEELLHNSSSGYEVRGFVDDDPNKLGVSIVNPLVLGSSDQLPELVERERVDKIVVALSDRRGKLPLEALLTCKLWGVKVEEGTTFYEQLCGRIMLDNLRPSWIIFSRGFTVSPLVRCIKRLVDVLCAVFGLVLAIPLLPLIALLIKLDSRGPVLFTQQRVGQNGKLFSLLKFRSMQTDAEATTGPVYADADDIRITRVGRLLRIIRCDELPQLLNVLKGEMSLVGPRPERPFFVKQLEKEIPYYTQRLAAKPGITGWAQVNYHYSATTEDTVEKLQFDLYYINNMSLFLDLFIMLKTVKIVFLGEGAR
jgi:sugar transferase (PEP-CTERM system associated)